MTKVITWNATNKALTEQDLSVSGEANTASNVGDSGVGVFKQKTSVDLEFKKLYSSSGKLSVTSETSQVNLDISETTAKYCNLRLPGGDFINTGDSYMIAWYLDSSNNIYIALIEARVADGTGISNYQGGISVYKSTDSGNTWTQLGSSFGVTSYSVVKARLAVDSSGNVVCAYMSPNSTYPSYANIHAHFYNAGTATWGAVSDLTTQNSYTQTLLDLVCDAADGFHLLAVGRNSESYEQFYYFNRTSGTGGSWGSVEYINSSTLRASSNFGAIMYDSSNNPIVSFLNNASATSSKTTVARKSGGSWTIYDSSYTDQPYQAAIDSSDNVFVSCGTKTIKCDSSNSWTTANCSSMGMQITIDTSNYTYWGGYYAVSQSIYCLKSNAANSFAFTSGKIQTISFRALMPTSNETRYNLKAQRCWFWNKTRLAQPVALCLDNNSMFHLVNLTG